MLSLLFPRLCIACGVLLRASATHGWSRYVCHRCCIGACTQPATAGAPFAAVLPYDAPWSTALLRFKFGGALALAGPLGELLATSPIWGEAWDVAVPVPLHRLRLLSRGFDQALLLTTSAARRHRLAVRPTALTRTRATSPQSRLQGPPRRRNVAGAFAARGVAGLRVLLVDDVATTGATLDAAATALTDAGAASVGRLALLHSGG